MQIKKFLSLTSILIIFAVIGLPMLAGAQPEIPGGDGTGSDMTTTLPDVDVQDALTRIGNWAFYFLIVLGAIFIVVAGFQFLTAGGNPDSVTKARNTLTYALVGVALGVLAKGLVDLVQKILK